MEEEKDIEDLKSTMNHFNIIKIYTIFTPHTHTHSEVAQLCPTLCNPMDCSLPGSSIHGNFQARVLDWGAIAFSDELNCAVLMYFKFQ